jgi:small subunit ribosomal protein S17
MNTAEQNQVKQKTEKTITGKVISNKMNKTIVVLVERKEKHPLIGKYIKRSSKMYAHDEENSCQVGDVVVIKQTRPLSKTKRWALKEVLKRIEQ